MDYMKHMTKAELEYEAVAWQIRSRSDYNHMRHTYDYYVDVAAWQDFHREASAFARKFLFAAIDKKGK